MKKFCPMIVLSLALAMLAACGSGTAQTPETDAPVPSVSTPPPSVSAPAPQEAVPSTQPSESAPETGKAKFPEGLEPLEYTAEEWAPYLGGYVSLTTGTSLNIGEYDDGCCMAVPRPGDYRHVDIIPLTPGEDAVYITDQSRAVAALTLQNGHLLFESSGEDRYLDAFSGEYALSELPDRGEEDPVTPMEWLEPSPENEAVIARFSGDFVREDREIHLQVEYLFGRWEICILSPNNPHWIDVYCPKPEGNALLALGEDGSTVLTLTLEDGKLRVENTSGLADYHYLAGTYSQAEAVSGAELDEYAGSYEADDGTSMEIGPVCGSFRLRFSPTTPFLQGGYRLEEYDGKLYCCFGGSEYSMQSYTLTSKEDGFLVEDTLLGIEEPMMYHRVR